MASIIQIRRDTASNWTSANPILAQGEMGYETDTGKLKFGDGSTAWITLGYYSTVGGSIVGPASSTDNAIVRFDGTTGKLAQDSCAFVCDDGTLYGPYAEFGKYCGGGSPNIGGSVKLWSQGTANYFTCVQAATNSETWCLTLPPCKPTAGCYLCMDTSGNMGYATFSEADTLCTVVGRGCCAPYGIQVCQTDLWSYMTSYFTRLESAPSIAGNVCFMLPPCRPSAGCFLCMDTNGCMGFAGVSEADTLCTVVTRGTCAPCCIQVCQLDLWSNMTAYFARLEAPSTIGGNLCFKLPSACPTIANSSLVSDASGNMAWLDTPKTRWWNCTCACANCNLAWVGGIVPSCQDTVIIDTVSMNQPCGTICADTVIIKSTSLTSLTICANDVYFYSGCVCSGSAINACNITLNMVVNVAGTLCGNTTFIGSTNCGTVFGNTVFSCSSCNLGTVCGDSLFGGGINCGTICGNADFQCQASNCGAVCGNALFLCSCNVSSSAYIYGDVSFLGNSLNYNNTNIFGNSIFRCGSFSCCSNFCGDVTIYNSAFLCCGSMVGNLTMYDTTCLCNFSCVVGTLKAYLTTASNFINTCVLGDAYLYCCTALGANAASALVTGKSSFFGNSCSCGNYLCGDSYFDGSATSCCTLFYNSLTANGFACFYSPCVLGYATVGCCVCLNTGVIFGNLHSTIINSMGSFITGVKICGSAILDRNSTLFCSCVYGTTTFFYSAIACCSFLYGDARYMGTNGNCTCTCVYGNIYFCGACTNNGYAFVQGIFSPCYGYVLPDYSLFSGSPKEGAIAFDYSNHLPRIYNGSAWCCLCNF